MSSVEQMISQLERHRDALDSALAALREVSGAAFSTAARRRGVKQVPRKKRRLSAEGRQRIAEAARKRWAGLKTEQAEQSPSEAAPPSSQLRTKKTAPKKKAAKGSAAKPKLLKQV